MRLFARAFAVVALAAIVFLLPTRGVGGPAAVSPHAAATRAEAAVPPLGLIWGKLRGWERRLDGWELVWQPAHGAWTVRAWVPDGMAPIRHQLDVAPWLPGARLSGDAARLAAGAPGDPGVPTERVGRRDWDFGAVRLLGSVRAGSGLGPDTRSVPDPWLAVIVGLVLAGAVARKVLPGLPSRGWRRAVIAAGAVACVILPWLVPLGERFFRAGVRPWVNEITFMTVSALMLAGVVVGAARFPMMSGRPAQWWTVASALALGALAGRVWPVAIATEVAGSVVRLPALVALTVLAAWMICLAADGLRELVSLAGTWRGAVLAVLAAMVVAFPGASAAPAIGACAAAGRGRGEGAWVSLAVAWGWVVMSLASSCAWPGAVRDAGILAVAGWVAVAAHVVASSRTTRSAPAPQLGGSESAAK